MQNHKTQGVTLIELAIVLTIIGLIVGGITVGDAMITNSKMRSVAVEKDRLAKATKMFQDKYYSLPGDMKNAESLWATASGGCPWGARSGNQTCNGDGNGKVDVDVAASPNQTREFFTFWQHMSIAGIMEESFTGIKGTGAFSFTSGTNVPKSAWSEAAGWNIRYVGVKSSDSIYYDGSYSHIFMLGDTGFDSTSNGVMTPDEQMSLDKKFDDSFPHTGNIRSAKGTFVGACVTGTAPNFTYNIASKDSVCAPVWITGF